MILALVSDSHGVLPSALFERLSGVDRIFHLGDLGPLALLADLAALAPVEAVRGNVDAPGLPELPEQRAGSAAGLAYRLRHEPWPERELEACCAPCLFAHGHTHLPVLRRRGAALICCPGALTRPRGGHPASFARLGITPSQVDAAIIALVDGRVLARERWPRA